jgi:hypothetical protein
MMSIISETLDPSQYSEIYYAVLQISFHNPGLLYVLEQMFNCRVFREITRYTTVID